MLSPGFLSLARRMIAADTVSANGTLAAVEVLQPLWEHAGLHVRRQVSEGIHVNLLGGPSVLVVLLAENVDRIRKRLELRAAGESEERGTIAAVIEPMLLLPAREAGCADGVRHVDAIRAFRLEDVDAVRMGERVRGARDQAVGPYAHASEGELVSRHHDAVHEAAFDGQGQTGAPSPREREPGVGQPASCHRIV